jgi:hypothetical protein
MDVKRNTGQRQEKFTTHRHELLSPSLNYWASSTSNAEAMDVITGHAPEASSHGNSTPSVP